MIRTILIVVCTLFSFIASINAKENSSKNIIYMIGDGMGANYLTAYRYWIAQQPNHTINSTILDKLWVGNAMTYPDDDTFVTDSAAGATALATTTKTYNGAIAVDHQHQPLHTLLIEAKKRNKSTALLATSDITHATPASFYAHQKQRNEYNQIADQLYDNQWQNKPLADLVLAGGLTYLKRQDRNLLQEFTRLGYQLETDFNKLQNLNKLPALGVFHDKGFDYALDSQQNRLALMTRHALNLLANPTTKQNGFFMLIEASQIDWCGHANDIACALAEMHDFARAIEIAHQFVLSNPDTLLVVTADHETGGLSIGADGEYNWNPQVLNNVRHSLPILGKKLASSESPINTWYALTQIELSEEARAELTSIQSGEQNKYVNFARKVINQYSLTGWTSGGHTAADVPVLAAGADARLFYGFQDNTQIAEKLFYLLSR
ncbi:alkaline phosphatase [Catenovulum sediminis]|uniref:Alkaline phosphatase n=1 Tax=Catenovulum sediminis TaxID=1740262 RepID=A0ABV1RL18_9ALTE